MLREPGVTMTTNEYIAHLETEAEALAEALRFAYAVLGANHLTLGASHGFDACRLCAAESTVQDALRAYRSSQESSDAS